MTDISGSLITPSQASGYKIFRDSYHRSTSIKDLPLFVVIPPSHPLTHIAGFTLTVPGGGRQWVTPTTQPKLNPGDESVDTVLMGGLMKMPLSNKESECPPSSVTAQVDLIMTGQVPDNEYHCKHGFFFVRWPPKPSPGLLALAAEGIKEASRWMVHRASIPCPGQSD
ncbi:Uncharacterized protein HZ326_16872 [Fusarium oxysporum f. sp. albedinis]|nr:Uncharacterized protein HZ326_16872 [Fusarium oxysporum f. sp. albedinis]